MNAKLSIVRTSSRSDADGEEIRIIIHIAMGKRITAVVSPENLAMALTGKSEIPIELNLRNVTVSTVIPRGEKEE